MRARAISDRLLAQVDDCEKINARVEHTDVMVIAAGL